MSKKKIKKEEYPITISDWIVFLESNVATNTSLYVLLGTILIALVIALFGLEITTHLFYIFVTLILFIICVLLIGRLSYASKRIKHYQRLSKKIMEGKITDPKKVLEEYNKFKRKDL